MARKPSPQPVPSGVTGSGRSLWESTVAAYELEAHELPLLREVCRTASSIDALQAVVDRDGVLDSSPQGVRAHPALVELRQQRLCLAKLLSQLAIPVGESVPGGGKKAYGIRGVAS